MLLDCRAERQRVKARRVCGDGTPTRGQTVQHSRVSGPRRGRRRGSATGDTATGLSRMGAIPSGNKLQSLAVDHFVQCFPQSVPISTKYTANSRLRRRHRTARSGAVRIDTVRRPCRSRGVPGAGRRDRDSVARIAARVPRGCHARGRAGVDVRRSRDGGWLPGGHYSVAAVSWSAAPPCELA